MCAVSDELYVYLFSNTSGLRFAKNKKNGLVDITSETVFHREKLFNDFNVF